MSSFSNGSVSIDFTVDRTSFSEQREARAEIQEIPGSDEFTVDLAGRQPHRLSAKITLANAAAWGALNSAIGTVGLLQIDTLDSHEVVIMSLGRDAPYLGGQVSANIEVLITD